MLRLLRILPTHPPPLLPRFPHSSATRSISSFQQTPRIPSLPVPVRALLLATTTRARTTPGSAPFSTAVPVQLHAAAEAAKEEIKSKRLTKKETKARKKLEKAERIRVKKWEDESKRKLKEQRNEEKAVAKAKRSEEYVAKQAQFAEARGETVATGSGTETGPRKPVEGGNDVDGDAGKVVARKEYRAERREEAKGESNSGMPRISRISHDGESKRPTPYDDAGRPSRGGDQYSRPDKSEGGADFSSGYGASSTPRDSYRSRGGEAYAGGRGSAGGYEPRGGAGVGQGRREFSSRGGGFGGGDREGGESRGFRRPDGDRGFGGRGGGGFGRGDGERGGGYGGRGGFGRSEGGERGGFSSRGGFSRSDGERGGYSSRGGRFEGGERGGYNSRGGFGRSEGGERGGFSSRGGYGRSEGGERGGFSSRGGYGRSEGGERGGYGSRGGFGRSEGGEREGGFGRSEGGERGGFSSRGGYGRSEGGERGGFSSRGSFSRSDGGERGGYAARGGRDEGGRDSFRSDRTLAGSRDTYGGASRDKPAEKGVGESDEDIVFQGQVEHGGEKWREDNEKDLDTKRDEPEAAQEYGGGRRDTRGGGDSRGGGDFGRFSDRRPPSDSKWGPRGRPVESQYGESRGRYGSSSYSDSRPSDRFGARDRDREPRYPAQEQQQQRGETSDKEIEALANSIKAKGSDEPFRPRRERDERSYSPEKSERRAFLGSGSTSGSGPPQDRYGGVFGGGATGRFPQRREAHTWANTHSDSRARFGFPPLLPQPQRVLDSFSYISQLYDDRAPAPKRKFSELHTAEMGEGREPREPREPRDPRAPREPRHRVPRFPRDPRHPRDLDLLPPTHETLLPPLLDPIPTPSEAYLAASLLPPTPLPASTPANSILVILDLNGALLHRSKGSRAYAASKRPTPRPYLPQFLSYLFANFSVMVWSSAQPGNVASMVQAAFTPEQQAQLVAIWGRDRLGLSPAQMCQKVVVYKRLEKVWDDLNRAAGPTGVWGQHNTVLIDDSRVKASGQPYNLVEVDTWEGMGGSGGAGGRDRGLVEVAGYLEEMRRGRYRDVNAYIRAVPFQMGDGWGAEGKGEVGGWFWGEGEEGMPHAVIEGEAGGVKMNKKAKARARAAAAAAAEGVLGEVEEEVEAVVDEEAEEEMEEGGVNLIDYGALEAVEESGEEVLSN